MAYMIICMTRKWSLVIFVLVINVKFCYMHDIYRQCKVRYLGNVRLSMDKNTCKTPFLFSNICRGYVHIN
jgi:hypothetical protein